jgi:hypothetical protein
VKGGTNLNENLHMKINHFLHGTRLISLEVLLARLAGFFYEHNRRIMGLTTEAWRSKIHLNHDVPFTDFKKLDGLSSSQIVHQSATISVAKAPTASAVEEYLKMLLSVTQNIHSRSLLYIPLEIVMHCKFEGFSFPALLCDVEFSANVLSDLSLSKLSDSTDLFEAISKQADFICKLENNNDFARLVSDLTFSSTSFYNSLKKAALDEMKRFPNEYVNNFPSENRLDDFLSSKDIDFYSPAVTNSVCVAVASALKSVVIYLFPDSTEKVHVVIPVFHDTETRIINNHPLFIMVSHCDGKLIFSCTETVKENKCDELQMSDESLIVTDSKCTCGKGRKNTTASCTGPRCPCLKLGESCTGNCGCQLCENSFGKRFDNSVKLKPCRCGENHSSADKSFCISSLCSCRKHGFSCNDLPQCLCNQCKNVHGSRAKLDSAVRKRKITDRAFLLQKSSGKLPCMSSVEFFKRTNQRLIQSIWCDSETILVFMLSNYLRSTEHRVSIQRLTELYRVYAAKIADVRSKSPHQVLYKIRHIDRQRSICRR